MSGTLPSLTCLTVKSRVWFPCGSLCPGKVLDEEEGTGNNSGGNDFRREYVSTRLYRPFDLGIEEVLTPQHPVSAGRNPRRLL